MLCQSVCSFHSPVCGSFCLQLVAIENVATDVPLCVNFDSASLPRRPIRMTLLTLRDAIFPCNVTHNPPALKRWRQTIESISPLQSAHPGVRPKPHRIGALATPYEMWECGNLFSRFD